MRAWRLYGPNDIRLENVPDPVLEKRHLIAETLCAQPSVTETQIVAGSLKNWPGFLERIKKEGSVPLPGHEYCARVVEVNEKSGFQPGDRVAGVARIPCGACSMCLSGHPILCQHSNLMGMTIPGCFSELVSLPERALVKVDSQLSDSECAALQPVGDSLAAVATAEIKVGDTIAILGQGCLGINSLQIARASGAGLLIAVDVRDDVLEKSKELGAHHAINAKGIDPVKAIKELTGGIGADIVFEAAGGNPTKGLAGTRTIDQAIDIARPGGKVMIQSIYGQPVELPMDKMRSRALQIIFPNMSTTSHLEQTSRLIAAGQILLKPIITHVLSGIESVPKAFEITGSKGSYNSIMPAQVMMLV